MAQDGSAHFSDADLRQFSVISPVLLTITDRRGVISSVSDSWADVLGWSCAQVVGRNFVDYLHPDDLERTLAAFTAQPAQTGLVNRYRHADGSYRVLEWSTGSNGTLIWGVARDITELTSQARQQQAVADLGRTALEGRDNDTLLAEVVPCVGAALGVPVVVVLTLDDDRLRMRSWSTPTPRSSFGLDDFVPVDERTVSGRAVLTGRPARSTDVQAAGPGHPYHVQVGARGCVSVPILSREGVWGALTSADVVPRDFDDSEVRFLEQVAYIIGAAVQRRDAEDRLQHLATHDALTGLPNRELLHARVDQALTDLEQPIGLLLCDLDGFKDVNDSLGHATGDDVLAQLADRLRSVVGPADTVSRLGGDEFAICIVGRDTEIEILGVVHSIIRTMRVPFPVADLQVSLSTSIGVVISPRHGRDTSTLLRRADIAMYRAKATGLGWGMYDASLDEATTERLALTAELRAAIEAGDLAVHYQPVVDLATGRLHAVEALCRWPHPRRSNISPTRFIPLAEQTGSILPLTSWVLRQVVQDVQSWRAAGYDIRCSVNLSMAAVTDTEASADLLDQLVAAAPLITLEITESWLVDDHGREMIAKLSANGVRLSLDDFGTGFSSLASLHRFPVQQVKLDRAFVLGLDGPRGDQVLHAMTALGHALDMEVVAEGIEDEMTSQRLRASGLRWGQGFLWSPAVPASELGPWLATLPPPAC